MPGGGGNSPWIFYNSAALFSSALMLESLVEPREGSRRPPRRASARQLLGQVRAPLAPRPATFQPTRAPSVVAGAAPVALDATVGEQGQQMARCSPTCSWLLAAACCRP